MNSEIHGGSCSQRTLTLDGTEAEKIAWPLIFASPPIPRYLRFKASSTSFRNCSARALVV